MLSRWLFLLAGLLVWAVHLTFVYGFNALACARQFAGTEVLGIGVVPLAVLAATAVALVVNVGILAMAMLGRGPGIGDERDSALRRLWRVGTAVGALLALVAVAWTGLPALMLRPCA